jgi:phage terminase large subunit
VFATFKEIIQKWKLTPYVRIRESDFNIRFVNGSEIIFLGLDDETKLLSLNNIGTIFIEEAYEVPQNMVEQLNLRMRGNVANQ